MQPSSSGSPSQSTHDTSTDPPSSLESPPSPPPKPASPIHSRDASLQQILRQFDPLSPERQSTRNNDDKAPAPPPKDSPPSSPLREKRRESLGLTRRASILSGEKPPPAEPDQPFEFHRFLEQMRHKSADGVARYMKRQHLFEVYINGSFLHEFNKRSWTVSEQQKIVHDFLNVIILFLDC